MFELANVREQNREKIAVARVEMSPAPIFTALSTSTRQLFLLLRCIAFAPRAEVCITPDGLRFTVEEARTVQGSTILEKNLFSSYKLSLAEENSSIPAFQVNITVLLETLQIFGLADASSTSRYQNSGASSSYAAAFNTPALNLGGTCRISYTEIGAPLAITIDEGSVRTVCNMNTYSLPEDYNEDIEIPLDRNNLTLKVIMRSAWLYHAITELASTNSEVLVLNASSTSEPYLCLEGHGGPFGDATVDFTPEVTDRSNSARASHQPLATEIFTVRASAGHHGRVKQRYRFELIKKAGRAMQLASKVSLRQDGQGVLSLQFMIESFDPSSAGNAVNNSRASFVDFRFIPLFEGSGNDDDGQSEADADEPE